MSTPDGWIICILREGDFMKGKPPSGNKILEGLPAEESALIKAELQPFSTEIGVELLKPEDGSPRVYFPDRGVLSLIIQMRDGRVAEVGLVGPEGVVGYESAFHKARTTNIVQVQVEAAGNCIDGESFEEVLNQCSELQRRISAFTYSLAAQIEQNAGCDQLHFPPQRLAKWLLLTQDLLDGSELSLKSDFVQRMLFGGDSEFRNAIQSFLESGLISEDEHGLRIVDRKGLQGQACECAGRIREIYHSWRQGQHF